MRRLASARSHLGKELVIFEQRCLCPIPEVRGRELMSDPVEEKNLMPPG